MNIGKTGIYLSLSWLIALVVLTLTLFAFAWLLILRIRKLSHKPTRTWATVCFIVLCSAMLVILAFAYHDLVAAGQDYDRDMSYECDTLVQPRDFPVRSLGWAGWLQPCDTLPRPVAVGYLRAANRQWFVPMRVRFGSSRGWRWWHGTRKTPPG